MSSELPGQPNKRLLKIIVALGTDIIVLQILLAMEGDALGLDLALLNVHLVSAQHDGNVITDPRQVAMPVGNVLVGDAGSDVEHDDTALTLDVVAVAQAAKLLLPGSVPHVKDDGAVVGVEEEGMDLDTDRGDVFLFKLAGQVALDKGGLASAAVADQNLFELGSVHCGLLLFEEAKERMDG